MKQIMRNRIVYA